MIEDLPSNIRKRIQVEPGTGCWLWTAGTAGKGYAYGWWNGAMSYMHRVTYHLLVDDSLQVRGAGRGGTSIDHLCETQRCVNPAHLELVTHSENLRRFHRSHPDHHQKAWATRRRNARSAA